MTNGERSDIDLALDVAQVLTSLGLPAYCAVTIAAFSNELPTETDSATAGFWFIILGMPLYMVGWICLTQAARFVPVRPNYRFAALVGAGLMLVAYSTIG